MHNFLNNTCKYSEITKDFHQICQKYSLLALSVAIHQTFTPPNLPTYGNTKVTS